MSEEKQGKPSQTSLSHLRAEPIVGGTGANTPDGRGVPSGVPLPMDFEKYVTNLVTLHRQQEAAGKAVTNYLPDRRPRTPPEVNINTFRGWYVEGKIEVEEFEQLIDSELGL